MTTRPPIELRQQVLVRARNRCDEGRATVQLLRLNSYERIAERAELIRAGRLSGPVDP